MTRVVNISNDSQQPATASNPRSTVNEEALVSTQPKIRVTLTDNPVLRFVPLGVEDDKLLGRSSIYGEVSVPVNSIQYLHFGEKAKTFTSVFEEWVVRPAERTNR